MRPIDADELNEFLNWTTCKPPYSKKQIRMWLDMARKLDAVPVIRCEKCEHGKPWNDTEMYECTRDHIRLMKKDGFCSWAERKEE